MGNCASKRQDEGAVVRPQDDNPPTNIRKPGRKKDDKTSTMIREDMITAASLAKCSGEGGFKQPQTHMTTVPENGESDISSPGHAGSDDSTEESTEESHAMKNIFADPITISANYTPPHFPKTSKEAHFLDQCLRDNFFFSTLSVEERIQLVDAMKPYKAKKQQDIIKQGDTDKCFYVLQKGQAIFLVDGKEVGKVGQGGSYGELALCFDSRRKATVRAESDCDLFFVDQKTYRMMLANNAAKGSMDNIKVLKKVEFFKDMDDQELTKISDALIEVSFRDGQFIVRKGEGGSIFYIIKRGNVIISDIGSSARQYENQNLTVGDFFGERALLTGEGRAANVKANGECVVLALSKESFEKILGPLQNILDKAVDKRMIMGLPTFAKTSLSQYELYDLADRLELQTFPKGKILAKEGDDLSNLEGRQALFVVKEGKLKVTSSKEGTLLLNKDDYCVALFREKALATVVAVEETICKRITMQNVERTIGNLDRLNHTSTGTENKLDETVNLDVLQKHRILGAGAFGQVWLVNHIQTKETYALKIQNKRDIIKENQVEGIVREKNLMANIDHPFVIKLVNAFQDDTNLFMVMRLVLGGELYTVIQTGMRGPTKKAKAKKLVSGRGKKAGVPENAAKFYAACIFEGINHMHQMQILYRDLKPENVLIDSKGYCVLVDLGFAKVVTDKTYTICGTPFYLAPEILLSRGYDQGADHWALGVLVYEMLFGYVPFYSYDDDPMALYRRIVKLDYSLPSYSKCSSESHDLIKALLVKRPKRLGSLANGPKDIQNHPWLRDMPRDDLLSYSVKAPWIPVICNPFDVSNFDDWTHLEKKRETKSVPLLEKDQVLFKDF